MAHDEIPRSVFICFCEGSPTRLGFIRREPDSVSWFPADVFLRWVRKSFLRFGRFLGCRFLGDRFCFDRRFRRLLPLLLPAPLQPLSPLLLPAPLQPLLPWLWPVSLPLLPEPSRGSLFWQGPLPRPSPVLPEPSLLSPYVLPPFQIFDSASLGPGPTVPSRVRNRETHQDEYFLSSLLCRQHFLKSCCQQQKGFPFFEQSEIQVSVFLFRELFFAV